MGTSKSHTHREESGVFASGHLSALSRPALPTAGSLLCPRAQLQLRVGRRHWQAPSVERSLSATSVRVGLGVLGGKLRRQEEGTLVQEGWEKGLLPSCLHCASGVQESAWLSREPAGVTSLQRPLAEVTAVAPGLLIRP